MGLIYTKTYTCGYRLRMSCATKPFWSFAITYNALKANALNGRPTWYDLSLNFAPSLCHLAHEQAATMAVRNANRSLEVVSRGLPRFGP